MLNSASDSGDEHTSKKGELLSEEEVLQLLPMFRILSDQSRFRIMLSLFRNGERSVLDLMDDADLSQEATSHHLSIMRDAGMITFRRRGKYHFYSIQKREGLIASFSQLRNLFEDGAEKDAQAEQVVAPVVDSFEEKPESSSVIPQQTVEETVPSERQEKLHRDQSINQVCKQVLKSWGQERRDELNELITFFGLADAGATLSDIQERLASDADTPDSIAEEIVDMYQHSTYLSELIFQYIESLVPDEYKKSWGAKWKNDNIAEYVIAKLQAHTGVMTILQFILKQLNERWQTSIEVPLPAKK